MSKNTFWLLLGIGIGVFAYWWWTDRQRVYAIAANHDQRLTTLEMEKQRPVIADMTKRVTLVGGILGIAVATKTLLAPLFHLIVSHIKF